MKSYFSILLFSIFCFCAKSSVGQNFAFQFYDETFNINLTPSAKVDFKDSISQKSIASFYQKLNSGNYQPLINTLLKYKEQKQLNDWFYYQLIRKTVQQFSPKEENYERYTLYKWFLMCKSGYDAKLAIGKNELLFYVWSDEDISDIPYFKNQSKQYVCLNIHDYKNANYLKDQL